MVTKREYGMEALKTKDGVADGIRTRKGKCELGWQKHQFGNAEWISDDYTIWFRPGLRNFEGMRRWRNWTTSLNTLQLNQQKHIFNIPDNS